MKSGLYRIEVDAEFGEIQEMTEAFLSWNGGLVFVKLYPMEDQACIPDPYKELGTAWADCKSAMWNEFSSSKTGKLFIRAADKLGAFLERRFHG